MKPEKSEIVKTLQQLVHDNLNIPIELLDQNVDLFDVPEFEFDSVDEQELLADIEYTYSCKMTDRIKDNYRTISKIADQVIIAIQNKSLPT